MSSFPSQCMHYSYGKQGDPGGHHSLEGGHYGNIRVDDFQASAYRVAPWETAMGISASTMKFQANSFMPETGFDTRCMELDGGIFNFSPSSNYMPPPTRSSVLWNDQSTEGANTASFIPLQFALDTSLSVFDSQAHMMPVELVQSDFPAFPGLDNIGGWNEGLPVPVNDPLLLEHPVTWPVPVNNGDGYVDRFESVGRPILDLQPWVQKPSISLATSMQDHLSSLSPYKSVPSYDSYSPFQVEQPWDLSLQEGMEDIPLHSLPSYQPRECTSYNLKRSLDTTGSDSVPTESDLDTLPPVAKRPKTLKFCNIMPTPPSLLSNGVRGVDSNNVARPTPAKLRRRRRFNADENEATSHIRDIGACASCRVRKIRCTKGDVCIPCQHARRTLQLPTCYRGPLDQYQQEFLPPVIVAHLDQSDVKKLMSNTEFINNEIRVRLSLGPSFPSLSLMVCEFRTPDDKFLHVPDLTVKSNDHSQTFASIVTLPYGVLPASDGQLTQGCLDYVEAVSSCENISMGSSGIRGRLFDAIRRFKRGNQIAYQDNLLCKVIKISLIYRMLGLRFCFSKDSSLGTVGSLSSPASNSSRILNRQIKAALFVQLQKLIPEALLELDGMLKQQKKECWAVCLCAHLLLCICAEEIEVAIDAFVFSKTSSEGEDAVLIRQRGQDICRSLEKRTLEHSKLLLDGVLKGIMKPNNPFKICAQKDDESGLSEAETVLSNEIGHIIQDYMVEIAKRAKDDHFGGLSQILKEHKEFRARNSTRLVSKVLWTLC